MKAAKAAISVHGAAAAGGRQRRAHLQRQKGAPAAVGLLREAAGKAARARVGKPVPESWEASVTKRLDPDLRHRCERNQIRKQSLGAKTELTSREGGLKKPGVKWVSQKRRRRGVRRTSDSCSWRPRTWSRPWCPRRRRAWRARRGSRIRADAVCSYTLHSSKRLLLGKGGGGVVADRSGGGVMTAEGSIHVLPHRYYEVARARPCPRASTWAPSFPCAEVLAIVAGNAARDNKN